MPRMADFIYVFTLGSIAAAMFTAMIIFSWL
jgi:hypothetical protein